MKSLCCFHFQTKEKLAKMSSECSNTIRTRPRCARARSTHIVQFSLQNFFALTFPFIFLSFFCCSNIHFCLSFFAVVVIIIVSLLLRGEHDFALDITEIFIHIFAPQLSSINVLGNYTSTTCTDIYLNNGFFQWFSSPNCVFNHTWHT